MKEWNTCIKCLSKFECETPHRAVNPLCKKCSGLGIATFEPINVAHRVFCGITGNFYSKSSLDVQVYYRSYAVRDNNLSRAIKSYKI